VPDRAGKNRTLDGSIMLQEYDGLCVSAPVDCSGEVGRLPGLCHE